MQLSLRNLGGSRHRRFKATAPERGSSIVYSVCDVDQARMSRHEGGILLSECRRPLKTNPGPDRFLSRCTIRVSSPGCFEMKWRSSPFHLRGTASIIQMVRLWQLGKETARLSEHTLAEPGG